MLGALDAREITQVVLSDYTAGYKLDALGIRERFSAVHEGVRIGQVKPGTAGFERIAADLDVPPSSILHFGDRDDADGASARAAGCRVLIIGKDFRNFRELQSSLVQAPAIHPRA